MKQVFRYKWVLLFLAGDAAFFLWNSALGTSIFQRTTDSFLEMLGVIPPIFILLGLLDTWVPREKVVTHLGEGSGMRGISLAVLLGAFAAGPLYGAFPVSAVMMKKGASFFNIMVFIGAWATLKIPMFLFETQFLGGLFSVTRWLCSLLGIILIAFVMDRSLSCAEKQTIYAKHQET